MSESNLEIKTNMLKSAESFYHAAKQINETFRENADSIIPYTVNAAFAIELYLKLLLFLETERQFKGHDIYELWKLVSKKSKKDCSNEFNVVLKNHWTRSPQILNHKRRIGADLKIKKLDTVFKEMRSSFTQNRYLYEYKRPSILSYLVEIRNILLNQIKKFEIIK